MLAASSSGCIEHRRYAVRSLTVDEAHACLGESAQFIGLSEELRHGLGELASGCDVGCTEVRDEAVARQTLGGGYLVGCGSDDQ